MSSLPALQGAWLRAVLDADAPSEPRATCDSCVMCGGDPLVDEETRFRPDLKCCTALPQLPNFAIGRLLSDGESAYDEGRARLRSRLADRRFATPLGLGPTRAWLERTRGEAGFGRDPAMRCPYLSDEGGGRCTIWAHRNAMCATWFCRTERAIEGQRFWTQVRELLTYLEDELALWAAAQAGLEPACLESFVDEHGRTRQLARGELRVHTDGEGRLREADARRLWGRFYDDQEAFFRACGDAVSGLSWTSIEAQLGTPLSALVHRTRRAFTQLRSTKQPRVLRCAPLQHDELADGQLRVTSWYALREPVRLDAATAQGLDSFDGRPTDEVVAEAAERYGVAIDSSLLRLLADRGILLPDDSDDARAIETTSGVAPDDYLSVFRWFRSAEITGALELASDGKPVFMLRIGPKEIGLRDPDLHAFGRMLIERRNGFMAREAASWGPQGRPIGWARAQALLDKLLQGAVLRKAR